MPNALGSIKSSVGLGSGIPIQELVDESVAKVFDIKRENLSASELEVQSKSRILGKLKSKLSDLQTVARDISSPTNLLGKSANILNNPVLVNPTSTYLAASVSDYAQAGSYQVIVDNLAITDKYVATTVFSTDSTVIGAGTLNITLGFGQATGSQTFQIVVDSQNNDNTVSGICNSINQQTNITGVSASLIRSDAGVIMAISSNISGLPSTLNITVTNDNGSGLQQLATANMNHAAIATNALIHVDGAAVTLTSNHAANIISGVTFDLYQSTGALANTVKITNDSSRTVAKLKDFVEKYNEVVEFLDRVTQKKDNKNNNIYTQKSEDNDSDYDDKPVNNNDKADKGKKKKRSDMVNQKTGNGIFIGDITILSLRTALSQAVSTQISQVQYSSMSQIGILSDRKTGKLNLDEDKLKAAVSNDITSVVNLFSFKSLSAISASGVGINFDTTLDRYTKIPNGIVLTASMNLSSRLEKICLQRLELERKATQMQLDLTMKYSKLDRVLAQQKNNEASLMQSLAGMNQS